MDNTLSVGDMISSSGGCEVGNLGSLSTNLVTEFTESEVFGAGPSDNGYGVDWFLSFEFDNLQGFWNRFDFVFNAGTIGLHILYKDDFDKVVDTRLFDLELSSPSASSPGNQLLKGHVSNFSSGNVNGVQAGNVFNVQYGSRNVSFQEYFTNYARDVSFRLDQNTDTRFSGAELVADIGNQFTQNNGRANINGSHDGSISFSVPEPTSLVTLSIGLLILCSRSRRKA